MTTDIKITYINKSDNRDNPEVLVFMKPTESDLAAYSIAWQVIKNIGYNAWHKFTYTIDTSVVVTWDNGKSGTLPFDTTIGKNYALKNTAGGFALEEKGEANAGNEFDVINKVNTPGGISVIAFKDGKPIATKHHVAKNEKAEFVLHPKLYFGVTTEYEVGDTIDSAVMSEDFKEINLEGLSEVTVEMRGNLDSGYRFDKIDEVPIAA